MFRTLLIANRGEIACRIIRTAKRMGIETVAVYSDADQQALHVKLADQAIYIGASPAEKSYLNVSAILEAALISHAQAIHPGYGFLSESASLAQGCEQSNLVFIGPSVHALEIMGSKQQAKAALTGTQVPLTPGYHGLDQTPSQLIQEAKKIGFPLLIKAAAGGGGKGMRVVTDAKELETAFAAAAREAQSYFGDPTLILEKYIPEARHVEVQIFGDQHGHVYHLFDRDCSVQRRHQKIIEEAPAPLLSPETREKLYAAACEVAKTIQYVGAGTIEFLVEPSGDFYFMEMNTRLQVEHPVTESITGLDLVEWQIRVAQGEPLPDSFANLTPQGHAIECRIYAEDPRQHFLPSIGQLLISQLPSGEGIRLDTGYASLDKVTSFYDPLIAKLITTGQTRIEAVQKMQRALTQCHLAGITTNISFLQSIIQHPAFLNAQLSTQFLSLHDLEVHPPALPSAVLYLLFAYDYSKIKPSDALNEDCFSFHPFLQLSWQRSYQIHDKSITGTIHPHHLQGFTLTVEEKTVNLSFRLDTQNQLSVSDHQQTIQGSILEHEGKLYCFYEGQTYLFQRLVHLNQHESKRHANVSPMPGTIVAVLKQKGDQVQPDEDILIIEAMKMEHTIRAAEAGIIEAIFYQNGDQVEEGAQLFELRASHS